MADLVKLMVLVLFQTLATGGQTYDSKEQLCCEGKIHDRPLDEGTYSCCGTELISMERPTLICCNGQVSDFGDIVYGHVVCCGSAGMDTNYFVCSPKGEMVLKDEAIQSGECWATQALYNIFPNVCCGDQLIAEDQCCEGVIIDPLVSLCCGGKIFPLDNRESMGCCRTELIDLQEQWCCMEYVLIDENVQWAYKKLETVVPKDKPDGGTKYGCCNGQVVDYNIMVCCQANDIECCGNQLIDQQDKDMLCVDGQWVRRQSPTQELCGAKFLYDPKEYHCWNHKKLVKIVKGEKLCDKNGLSYNPLTQVCTRHSLLYLTDEDVSDERDSYCEP